MMSDSGILWLLSEAEDEKNLRCGGLLSIITNNSLLPRNSLDLDERPVP